MNYYHSGKGPDTTYPRALQNVAFRCWKELFIPSDFFYRIYKMFVTDVIYPLIKAEKDMLEKIQKDDGGFDISWRWYTDYKEFETARDWWRPRLTLDKMLFYEEEFTAGT